MRKLIFALAATSALAGPAFSAGNAYGHDPRSASSPCFGSCGRKPGRCRRRQSAISAAADRDEARIPVGLISDIYTYGDDGFMAGVDYHYAGDSTEATREYLDSIHADDDDDD